MINVRRWVWVSSFLASVTSSAAAQDAPDATTQERREETPVVVAEPPTPRVTTVAAEVPTTCSARAYAAARNSVVEVWSAGRRGAGVLVVDSRHVVTLLSIVELGHGIEITDADGNERHASIVLTADGDDLALLELDSALPGAPLAVAAWDSVSIGRPVTVIGAVGAEDEPQMRHRNRHHGMEEVTPWAVSEGVVASRGERTVQTDARIGAPPGSAIVGCDGALIGLRGAGWGHTTMPGVPALLDLASRIDRPQGYGGRIEFTAGLAAAAIYEDPQWLGGLSLSLGLVALDSITLAARGTYALAVDSPTDTDVATRYQDRLRLDGYVAWRQLLTFGRMPMYFELGGGASLTRLRDQQRRALVVDEGAGPAVRWRDDRFESWSVRPMGVINLFFGPTLLSYTLEVDIDREHVMHMFQVGFRS